MLPKVLVLVAPGCGLAACVRADRDVVYSETRYRWSSTAWREFGDQKQMTVVPVGGAQLYRINPDGSGKTRVLPKGWSGSGPLWSPDGRWILFNGYHEDRDHPQDRSRLYMVGEAGGTPHLVLSETDAGFYGNWSMDYSWSPDGRHISVAFCDGSDHAMAFTIDRKTKRRTSYPGFREVVWSPDARRAYLVAAEGRDQVLDLATGQKSPAPADLANPAWLDADRLIAITRMQHTGGMAVRVADRRGRTDRSFALKQIGGRDIRPGFDHATLAPPRGAGEALGLTVVWMRSDGGDYACFRLDVARHTATHLRNGPLLAASPNGRRYLSCNYDWVGPYKRGGERLGALVVGPFLSKGRAHRLTASMVSIGGADWRRPPHTPSAAHPRRAP